MDVEKTLRGMTLEQKVGQMFMARGLCFFPEETMEMFKAGLLGGLHVRSNDDAKAIADIQKLSAVPLFIATDMESGFHGGKFGGTSLPAAMAMGAIDDEKTAYEWAAIMARDARAYGVNFAFGPVVDLANDPDAPFTCHRAIAADKETIVRLAAAVIKGYQDNGLNVSAKHYPGAGRFPADNHIETLILDCPVDVFENEELYIYRELIQRTRLSGVMTGHVAVAAVDGDTPATASPKLTAYLKAFGFSGVLISDSLAMKGISYRYSPEKLLKLAMKAGHDIILGDYNISPKKQVEWMVKAVRDGEIPMAQLEASVRKLLLRREELAAMRPAAPDRAKDKQTAIDMSRRAVTLVGDAAAMEQFRTAEAPFFVLAPETHVANVGGEIITGKAESRLEKLLKERFPKAETMVISEYPSPMEIEAVLDRALRRNAVAFFAYAPIHSYKGTADLTGRLLALIRGLKDKIRVLALFGNPYAARQLPPLPCELFLYDGDDMEQAAVEALAGDFKPTATLPIPLKK